MNGFAKTLTIAALVTGAMAIAAPAFAAEPIVGTWKTKSGELAKISACGGSFCIRLTTGKYKGKSIGKVRGKGSSYSGTIIDPADDKTYSGSAKLSGGSMRMKGCALKIFCKTQRWSKQ